MRGPYWKNIGPRSFLYRAWTDILLVRPSRLVNKLHISDIPVLFHFRETVSERLKDQEDGVFIVRDSRRFPGEYTLTLRYIEFIVE